MIEALGLDPGQITRWFAVESTEPYTLARMSPEDTLSLADAFALAVRRCYIGDDALRARAGVTGSPLAMLIAAKLPDPGSTMAGDFGEILTYAFLAASKFPARPTGPLKWALKQDRTKPAPHSDVLLFVVPNWPESSGDDVLVCAEVKTKSTPGSSVPIVEALVDSGKDRTSRLARTLQWLKERGLHEEVGGLDLDILDRFVHPSDHPVSTNEFVAAAVVCQSLLDVELATTPAELPGNPRLLVLVVDSLYATYMSVFAAAAVAEPPPTPGRGTT